ncbi:MAPEG family protein [Enhygromyxa salina]|uniref:Microsomal glutathione S-transferase 1 n=1 Tax=Enhygromyxa salina TaxID=215803 RepID=A0A2S9XF58_9BACT|nr:MAPEG family protein [Enhygromyxa salina]PRP91390.1 MAPEG family protein [Enhygromyxa salina]
MHVQPEAFNVYLICVAALAFNLWFLVFMIGARRAKAKQFVNPEDAKIFKGEAVARDAEAVERVKAAHRNALENIPIFAILALLYVMTGASKSSAMAYFVTFTASRWLHSFMYLGGLQPFRTLTFALGLLVNIGLSIQLLLAALA